jgi:hypothetical protein
MDGSTNILVLFLIAIIGFIAGAIAAILYSEREKRMSEEDKLAPILKNGRFRLAAKLWRERTGSKLILDLGERVYASSQALTAEQRQEMIELADDWLAWLNKSTDVQTQPALAARIMPTEEPPLSWREGIVPPPPEIVAPPPSTPEPVALARPPLAAVPLPTPEPPPPEPKPTSIVEQIDAILQEMVRDTPLYTRGIRLAEDSRHGVVAWVGIEHYEGIDTVPYPEIQQLIRRAVAEWERRTERDRH